MDTDGCMTVAIVGGGASGVLSAVHLLRLGNPDLRVILIEPVEMGAGAAYVTNSPEHLLNVVAAKMSAYPDLPAHFLRWVNRITPTRPCEFVPRSLYRRYLKDVLIVAQSQLEQNTFTYHHANVTSITADAGGATLTLDNGLRVQADKVILAVGNQNPRTPETETPWFTTDPMYIGTPWSTDLSVIAPEDDVLLIGAGLTTVDVLLTLHKRGHHGQITAVSRHGRWPFPHANLPAPIYDLPELPPRDLRGLLRWLRHTIAQAERKGIPWQSVLDVLRPHTNRLWQDWSHAERCQFTRHVIPIWNIARHRIPKSSAGVVEKLTDIGQLRLVAGRLQRVDRFNTIVTATIQQPDGALRHIYPRWVINCTGPNPDLQSSGSPLLRQLFADGLITADSLRMGLETASDGALMNAYGDASEVMYAVGPLRRGGLLESTAIHEIREQAVALAQVITQRVVV
jgi:uncharacterized NAD(P)/FAD-binding protein YdhS